MGKKKSRAATPAAPKPKVFIGSSAEGRNIAQAIGANLEQVAEPYPWPYIFELSKTTVESLEEAAVKCVFAIFVFTPDDEVKFRGARLRAARDNVLWEHGLFTGKNGRDHTFIVRPSGVKNFKLPSDFLGVTLATYEPSRLENNLPAALSTACFHITQAIDKAIKASAAVDPVSSLVPEIKATPPPGGSADELELRTLAAKHVAELLSMIGGGTAGLSLVPTEDMKVRRWADNVLFMARDVFRRKQDDVYATWLRPDTSKPPELVSYAVEGAADLDSHHTFAAGEGLVGNSWSQSKAVGHSPGHPHEWWVTRKGCENNAFLCAPIGPFGGAGGVLGIGSDKGFEVIDDHVAILRMFASLLGFVVNLLPVSSDRPSTVPLKAIRSASSRNRSGA